MKILVTGAKGFVGKNLCAQLNNIKAVSEIDSPAALEILYEEEGDVSLITPEGESFVLSEKFTKEDYVNIKSQIENEEGKKVTNPDYTNYVAPARQAYAWQQTLNNPGTIVASCFYS